MLTVDEVEQIQHKKVATIIDHVLQLTHAMYCDKLVQEEKANQCHGCAIQHHWILKMRGSIIHV